MIAENLTTPVLHCILLALTPSERWNAARNPLDSSFTLEAWFWTFLVLAQVITIAVVCGLIAKKRELHRKYKQDVDRLSASNERLMLQVDELTRQLKADASETEMTSDGSSDVLEETEELVAIQ